MLATSLAAEAKAAIKISEAMSSSGSGGTADWFELTNTGLSSVNIAGYQIDDGSFAVASSVALNGVASIGAGESVVFLESSSPVAEIAAFRTFWDDGNALAGVQIGYYSGSGLSFSSSGDGVIIFDTLNANAIIDQVSFGAASPGVTFGYNSDTNTFGGLSVAGQYGAFNSFDTTPLNVGSPGAISNAVPEPSALVLAGMSLAGAAVLAIRRRIKK
jgi:hypothetical protein